ncbi:MAG: alpha-galactosidase [Lachnospiraceae bacterium]|nr:alpha-galactosidase [Lachnospiraceae bacterium]
MIRVIDKLFLLETANTTYAFSINAEGLPEHLHYGAPLYIADGADVVSALSHKVSHGKGTTVNYTKDSPLTIEDLPLEVSSAGKGDFREPMLLLSYADGSRTSDFVFKSYDLSDKITPVEGMPCAVAGDGPAGSAQTGSAADNGAAGTTAGKIDRPSQLTLHLTERSKGVRLDLIYTVFPACDVITRRAVLYNDEEASFTIRRLLSMQLDLRSADYKMITFGGNWGREMEKHETNITHGLHVNHTQTGVSSNRNNPFVMVVSSKTTERWGEGYGFNLVYSGNHYEACEMSGFYGVRFVSGIDPSDFAWTLAKGECFHTPEAVMTYSVNGYRGISAHMHAFVRKHIVRGKFRDKVRPILLNSWEASYFNISEFKLLRLAKKAADVGAELLVMDDGWFQGRHSDTTSLGDWEADQKKLPGGIRRLSKKVHDLGLQFGIWVEPEMISEDSDLYRAHPSYAMQIPGREQSLGRNQMLLDLTNPEVVAFVKSAMRKVFSEGVDYVKWDMNRMFSDVFSYVSTAERQGETAHRWVLGLYDILNDLMREYPEILFEGCSSGGNRFDLGMLCYFPQIWGSDDTDAIMRTHIQEGYSYGYPLSTVTAHVSDCPNHQTLRDTPLYTRYNVAAFGVLGYELNLSDLSSKELNEIAAQIKEYKRWREVFFAGDFYRVDEHAWTVVDKDRRRAVAMLWNELAVPNDFRAVLKTAGLDDEKMYHVYNLPLRHDLKEFGNLVNMIAPVHIKQNSLLHDAISKVVHMDSETEDYRVSGALLNNAGIVLAQNFGGTGYTGQTRLFQDFASRMYYIEEIEG